MPEKVFPAGKETLSGLLPGHENEAGAGRGPEPQGKAAAAGRGHLRPGPGGPGPGGGHSAGLRPSGGQRRAHVLPHCQRSGKALRLCGLPPQG